MFARPSTGPVMLGRTARSRRRLMAVSSPRSRAVRVRRFWLKGRSSGSMPLIPDSIHTVWYHDGYSTTDAGDRSEMPPTTTERLADYETRYRELAAQLATIGLIHSGSVTRRYTRCPTPGCKCHADPPQPHRPPRRYTRCQTPGCKCHADPPQPHGPYYQWTAKNNGKTVTRRLTENEAQLYQEWIANDRRLRHLIQQMRQIAAKAAELKLKQAANP